MSGLPTLPSMLSSHSDNLGRTPTTKLWFRVDWLTSQARYVRVCISRRAIHASCESPWHFSAKRHVLGACFSLMAPFRTRFSRYEMAHSANVQRLVGCLYTLRYFYIPSCRFTAQRSRAPASAAGDRDPARTHKYCPGGVQIR